MNALQEHTNAMQLRLEHIRDKIDPLVWEELHAIRIMLSNLILEPASVPESVPCLRAPGLNIKHLQAPTPSNPVS